MKIVAIEISQEKLALKTPFKTALRTAWHVEFVRVKLLCDNGLSAFGEAPATKAITGEGIEEILQALQDAKRLFLGKSIEEALLFLHTNASLKSSARAALDMALVTLHAMKDGKILYEYFGAKTPHAMKSAITISLNDRATMLEDAQEAYMNGMSILKIKLGSDILHAIASCHEIAKILPHAMLLIDANQAWSEAQSKEFIDAMQDVKIELIEQPVIACEREALKRITEYSRVTILADEAVFTLDDVKEVMQNRAADMINIKLMKCGGVTPAIKILEYARKHNIACMLGSMLEGPYSINIALHLALAYSDVIKYLDLDSPLLLQEMPKELDFVYAGSEILLKSVS
jgi:L-alanine-DL-glutamate epimerase-like enolase superfamily enzyme